MDRVGTSHSYRSSSRKPHVETDDGVNGTIYSYEHAAVALKANVAHPNDTHCQEWSQMAKL